MRQFNASDINAATHRNSALRLRYYLLAAILLICVYPCHAGTYLLIKSGNAEIYNRFENSLKTTLNEISTNNTLISRTIDSSSSPLEIPDNLKFDAMISAGIAASIVVSKLHLKSTTIMSMIPRDSYSKLSASGTINCKIKNCLVMYIDQPVIRQLRLLKLALPETKNIAVISSSESDKLYEEIVKTSSKLGITVNSIKATTEDMVLTQLNQNLANSDVLMAIPDPVIYNRNTARAILLTTFHQHMPLFAYSQSFVRAGATVGIFSTPEDIAHHVAELITSPTPTPASHQGIYPKYYTLDLNQRAADALGISIPDLDLLTQRLKAYENE